MYFMVSVPMCEHPSLISAIYYVKFLLSIIRILAPIFLVIFSMVTAASEIVKADTNTNDLVRRASRSLLAALLIYLIPSILSMVINFMGVQMNMSCWNNAELEKIYFLTEKYNHLKEEEAQKLQDVVSEAQKAYFDESKNIATAIAHDPTSYVSNAYASDLANKMIEVASKELGYKEKKSNYQLDSKTANAGSNNYTKYGRDFTGNQTKDEYHYAWCAVFVWWVTKNTIDSNGRSVYDNYINKNKDMTMLTYAKAYLKGFCDKGENAIISSSCSKNGKKWYNSKYYGGKYVPKRGDIIVFNWDKNWNKRSISASHVGIVDTVSEGVVYTIEGNSGNSVSRRTYSINSASIMGYAVWE